MQCRLGIKTLCTFIELKRKCTWFCTLSFRSHYFLGKDKGSIITSTKTTYLVKTKLKEKQNFHCFIVPHLDPRVFIRVCVKKLFKENSTHYFIFLACLYFWLFWPAWTALTVILKSVYSHLFRSKQQRNQHSAATRNANLEITFCRVVSRRFMLHLETLQDVLASTFQLLWAPTVPQLIPFSCALSYVSMEVVV